MQKAHPSFLSDVLHTVPFHLDMRLPELPREPISLTGRLNG